MAVPISVPILNVSKTANPAPRPLSALASPGDLSAMSPRTWATCRLTPATRFSPSSASRWARFCGERAERPFRRIGALAPLQVGGGWVDPRPPVRVTLDGDPLRRDRFVDGAGRATAVTCIAADAEQARPMAVHRHAVRPKNW